MAALLVICLAVAGFAVRQWSVHRSAGGDQTGTTAEPGGSNASPVITPALAAVIVQQYWPVHEEAVVRRDAAQLRRLDTGAMAAFEPNAVVCGCTAHRKMARPLLDASYYVPRQTSYPAFFVATARTTSYWTEVMVFTKTAATKPWLVSENSGVTWLPDDPDPIGAPSGDGKGYVVGPTLAQHARAKQAAGQLAQLWQQTKALGAVPPQQTFDASDWLQARLARMAAHKNNGVQANGLRARFTYYVDPHDPLVEVAAGPTDLACQAVRVKVVYTGATRREMVFQDLAQHNWGKSLAPGLYRSIVSRDVRQTCFVVPQDGTKPIQVLDQGGGGIAISLH